MFYGHVLGCKGLQRTVVSSAFNEIAARERSRERLYVGLSRATDLLVLVGDPAVVRAMGGHEVAAVWDQPSIALRAGRGEAPEAGAGTLGDRTSLADSPGLAARPTGG